MEIEKALEVKKALITLAEVLGYDIKKVASNVCFLDDDKYKILIEASNIWNKFDSATLIDRGKMLGIEITTHNQSPDADTKSSGD